MPRREVRRSLMKVGDGIRFGQGPAEFVARLPLPAALRWNGNRFALARRFVDQWPFPRRRFAAAILQAEPPAELPGITPATKDSLSFSSPLAVRNGAYNPH